MNGSRTPTNDYLPISGDRGTPTLLAGRNRSAGPRGEPALEYCLDRLGAALALKRDRLLLVRQFDSLQYLKQRLKVFHRAGRFREFRGRLRQSGFKLPAGSYDFQVDLQ